MIIKINDFNNLPHKVRTAIVEKYFEKYELQTLNKDSSFLSYNYDIKETGKHPEIIEHGYSIYYIKCKKTRTSIVFNIWKAV